jgi:hypothetical protein
MLKSRNFRLLLVATFALLVGIVAGSQAWAQAKPEPGKGPSPFFVERKHDEAGVKCVDCHVDAKKAVAVPLERCVVCHGKGDVKAFAAGTAGTKPVNPHETRHYGVEADCGLCHLSHDEPVNFCADCHPRYQFKMQ